MQFDWFTCFFLHQFMLRNIFSNHSEIAISILVIISSSLSHTYSHTYTQTQQWQISHCTHFFLSSVIHFFLLCLALLTSDFFYTAGNHGTMLIFAYFSLCSYISDIIIQVYIFILNDICTVYTYIIFLCCARQIFHIY